MIEERLARMQQGHFYDQSAKLSARIKREMPKTSALVSIEECQEEFVFKVYLKADRSVHISDMP